MAQGNRVQRVAELLRQELGRNLIEKVKDPKVGFVTITEVRPSPDLRHAKIFFSSYGEDVDREESQKALNRASGFLGKEVGRALKMKYTPKLHFFLDDSLDHAQRVDSLLRAADEGIEVPSQETATFAPIASDRMPPPAAKPKTPKRSKAQRKINPKIRRGTAKK